MSFGTIHYLTEKELQSHLVHFPLKVTPSLPIAIVCGSSSPGAACPTRPWQPPSSTGRWSPPQRWCPGEMGSDGWGGQGEDYLAVPVVVLPQVPVPALTGHVEGGEAHVPVWKKNDRNMSRKRFWLLCQTKHSTAMHEIIFLPAGDWHWANKLTSGVVGHHPLLGVLGQHKHKSLVHGALGGSDLSLIWSFWFNLSTWSTILLPAWMTTLVASTPCTVSPSYTWLDCSQQWVSKWQDIFMGLSIRPVQWKGKLSKGKQNLRSLWRHISFQHSVSTALYDKIFCLDM